MEMMIGRAGQRTDSCLSGADGNLDTKGIPTVYVDRRPEEEVSDGHVFVESDNPYGGYLATRELIHQGCKKIVFLTDMQQESSKITRYQGYCRALTEAGLELNPSLILQVERIDIDVAREDHYRCFKKRSDV